MEALEPFHFMIRRRSVVKTVRSGTGRVIKWKPCSTLWELPTYDPNISICDTVCFGTLGIIQWNVLVSFRGHGLGVTISARRGPGLASKQAPVTDQSDVFFSQLRF